MPTFITVASPVGFILGVIVGLVPLGLAMRYSQWRAGILGAIACIVSGFGCGVLGGIPMMIIASAVVISYAYVNRQDPFTSRQAFEEVNFEETRQEWFMRSMAGLGDRVRGALSSLARNRAGFLGFLGIMFFVVVTVFGPLFVPYEPESKVRMDRREPGARSLVAPPSYEHPFGLDWQGRDVLTHMVNGGQSLIITSLLAGFFATVVAVVLGSLAGLLGGWVDQVISAIANFILTVPSFPLLLVIASVINLDNNVFLAGLFSLLNWPVLMRAIRAQVFSLRERDYVEAAVALDLGMWHIVSREVFPNMISYIAVNYIFTVRVAMYSIVGLVFLGLVPLVEPDWGVMIFMGRQQGVLSNPSAGGMMIAPVIAIALFQLSLVMFTRSLEEVFNPRLRSGL
jgi:peptide/nickel transport system permease protein